MAFMFNSNKKGSGITLSNNNLTISTATNYNGSYTTYNVLSNTALTSGKYYCEMLMQSPTPCFDIGVANELFNVNSDSMYSTSNFISYFVYNGNIYPGNTAYGASLTTGDILSIAIDIDNKQIKFAKNGTWYSSLTLPSGNSYYIYVTDGASNGGVVQLTANFGLNIFKYMPMGYSACESNGFYTRVKTTINDIKNMGDMISCRYTALISGSMGYFSQLGNTTATLIPITSSATPDGSFYWIYVGKDYLGRMKFIADRNLQNNISWDTINNIIGSGIITNNLLLSEIPKMSSNTTPSGTAFCSSNYSGYSAYMAFDKSATSTSWQSLNNSVFPQQLGYQFPSATIIKAYSLNMRFTTYAPKNWTFEASNDGTNWTVLDSKTNSAITSTGVVNYYSLSNTTAYLYYRINVSASTNTLCVDIGELDMYVYQSDLLNLGTSYNSYIRLLTGGVSATDIEDEWDKIIASSTLGGIITAGDNNIWNWSGIYSWSSSTGTTSANRIARGNTTVTTTNAPTGLASNTVNTTTGYRPILLIELMSITKYLIQANSNYYSINSNYYDSLNHIFTPLILSGGSTPNQNDVDNFGFSDLGTLINSMTVSSDTFRPIDKLSNVFQIKKYSTL